MNKYDQLIRLDNRVTGVLIRKGMLTHDEEARMLKQLPDEAGNAEYLPAYDVPATPKDAGENPTFEAV